MNWEQALNDVFRLEKVLYSLRHLMQPGQKFTLNQIRSACNHNDVILTERDLQAAVMSLIRLRILEFHIDLDEAATYSVAKRRYLGR